MAVNTQSNPQARGSGVPSYEHLVQFYEGDRQLVDAVGPYLVRALEQDGTAIVIATPAHRSAFEQYLTGRGHSSGGRARGLMLLDAEATLAWVVREGRVHRAAFNEVVGGLVRSGLASGGPLHAYGEMVGVLWERGNVLAAIELERCWNELGAEVPFSLFCGYRAEAVSDRADAQALEQVCHLHSSVVGDVPVSRSPGGGGVVSVELRARFNADLGAPAAARRQLAETLQAQGCEPATVEIAALVLSELASNAIKHVGRPFHIDVALAGPTLRLAVRDDSPLDGEIMPVRPTHGLAIVDELAVCWGTEDDRGGKVVWAELPA